MAKPEIRQLASLPIPAGTAARKREQKPSKQSSAPLLAEKKDAQLSPFTVQTTASLRASYKPQPGESLIIADDGTGRKYVVQNPGPRSGGTETTIKIHLNPTAQEINQARVDWANNPSVDYIISKYPHIAYLADHGPNVQIDEIKLYIEKRKCSAKQAAAYMLLKFLPDHTGGVTAPVESVLRQGRFRKAYTRKSPKKNARKKS